MIADYFTKTVLADVRYEIMGKHRNCLTNSRQGSQCCFSQGWNSSGINPTKDSRSVLRKTSITDALTNVQAEAREARDEREAGDTKEAPSTTAMRSSSEAPKVLLIWTEKE